MARGDYVGLNINHAAAGERAARYSARAADFFTDYTSGMTLKEIGAKNGITRERVRQIMTKIYGKVSMHGGRFVKARATTERKAKTMEAKYMAKYGCTRAQYKSLRTYPGNPLLRYKEQKRNSTTRNIEWNLDLWTWWNLWLQSGKWDKRGRTKGAYVIARFLDHGPYTPENICFITKSNNSKDISTNMRLKGIPLKGRSRNLYIPRVKKERVPKTHCKHGHEYTEDNTRHAKGGLRQCRACDRAAKKKIYYAKKAELEGVPFQ